MRELIVYAFMFGFGYFIGCGQTYIACTEKLVAHIYEELQ